MSDVFKLDLTVGELYAYNDSADRSHPVELVKLAFVDPEGEYADSEFGELQALVVFIKKASRELKEWVPYSSLQPYTTAVDETESESTSTPDSLYEDERSPELLDRGYSMVSWSDGLEDRPDNSKLPDIVTLLMAIQYDKEGSYGSSWKGKGEYRGIMANIDRKYDRLDKMTQDEIEGNRIKLGALERSLTQIIEKNELDKLDEMKAMIGESKIDAIADFSCYGLLYMTYVRDEFPNVFNVWVEKNVPKYLAKNIPFLGE